MTHEEKNSAIRLSISFDLIRFILVLFGFSSFEFISFGSFLSVIPFGSILRGSV